MFVVALCLKSSRKKMGKDTNVFLFHCRSEGQIVFTKMKETGPREIIVPFNTWRIICDKKDKLLQAMDEYSKTGPPVKFDLNEEGTKKISLEEFGTTSYVGYVICNKRGGVRPSLTINFLFDQFRCILSYSEEILAKSKALRPKRVPYKPELDEEKAYGFFWEWLHVDDEGQKQSLTKSSQTFWNKTDAIENAKTHKPEDHFEAELNVEGKYVRAWNLFDHVTKLFWYLVVIKINVETMREPCKGCINRAINAGEHRCMQIPDKEKLPNLLDTYGAKAAIQVRQNVRFLAKMIEEGRQLISAPAIWGKLFAHSVSEFMSLTSAETKQRITQFFGQGETHERKMLERAYLKAKKQNLPSPPKKKRLDSAENEEEEVDM
jgi:hypothetical protein